ncbi:MAG: TonB-denpendent receptor [Chitinophagaceae bacterium]|nr:TonB-denpendent receptor [Chitinophagaceae bacterium]
MRKLIILLLVISTAFSVKTNAQAKNGKISGTVVDGSSKIIESATITLRNAKDSSVAKISMADKAGNYGFENVAEGKYFVSISAVGHEPGYSEPIEVNATVMSVVVKKMELVPLAKSIDGVTVTSKKPLIEQKAGKTVINVDASQTNAGLNALELLEKSPGVSVDNDGNISVKGKQGVMILIDGKPTYLSGADLAALLKSMQSSNLEQIEIMTNPPAKYDAAGNSGIINIKTKKGMVKGMNGNANGSYNQGLYARFNGGLNLNYRNNKLNVFGGYNGGTYQGYNNLVINRNLYEADKTTLARTIDQVSRPHYKGVYHGAKAGIDYNFSKKDVAGFVVNTNFNTNDQDPTGTANLRDAAGNLIYKLISSGNNSRNSSNVSANFNYKHTFDSTGKEISADLDYVYYDNKSHTELNTQSYDNNNVKNGNDVILRGDLPSSIKIYSAKIDYVHPFKKGLKLEAGLKTSFVNTDNQVGYQRNSGSGWTVDDRSNYFLYDENINAAYAILSKSIKKWELTAGLRLENTNSNGHQLSNDSTFKRHYTNLFPNAGISYNASEKNQFSLSYSRRVARPDYQDLNPFTYFLDSLTYGQGNPYLQPQFTNNFEFSHTFKKFLTTTLNYTQTDDIITQLLKQNTEKNLTYQTKDNFSSMKQWGVAVMANFAVQKWWNMNVYANGYNNHYAGLYQNDPIDIQFTSFTGNLTNSFTLGKGWNAEVSGWFRSRGVDGLLVINNMGAVNSGISKQVLKKKGTLKLNVSDIFYTQKFSGYAKYSDVDVRIAGKRDSRQANLTFTYRFGKTTIAPERRRNGGAGDEQNRVKSGGN